MSVSQAVCIYVYMDLLSVLLHLTAEDLRGLFFLICHKLFYTFFLMLAIKGSSVVFFPL